VGQPPEEPEPDKGPARQPPPDSGEPAVLGATIEDEEGDEQGFLASRRVGQPPEEPDEEDDSGAAPVPPAE
jgi:hypothetical protein